MDSCIYKAIEMTAFQMEKLKAALSNSEYQIITDCAQSNISETPRIVPPLNLDPVTSSSEGESITQDPNGTAFPAASGEARVMMKVCVVIDLVELCLHTGLGSDASLATVQVVFNFFAFEHCWELISILFL